MLEHLELAERCARHVHRQMRIQAPLEDLVQIGREQLVLAAACYRVEHRVRFEAFAWPKVRFGIIDELRRQRVLRRVAGDGTVQAPNPTMFSLDRPIEGTDDAQFADLVVDEHTADPVISAEAHDLLDRIAALPARLRFVLLARLEGYEQPEIAELLKVSASRVAQLEQTARTRIGAARPVSV